MYSECIHLFQPNSLPHDFHVSLFGDKIDECPSRSRTLDVMLLRTPLLRMVVKKRPHVVARRST
jgi:hypothetical protein